MLEKYREWNAVSGKLFMLGLATSRLTMIRIPIVSSAISFFSSLLYVLGYQFWQSAVQDAYHQASALSAIEKKQFEHQYQHIWYEGMSAMFGGLASIVMLTAFLNPVSMGLACTWLFFCSNLFWHWAEKKHLQRLLNESPESPETHQKNLYYNYSFYGMLISLLSAISISFSLLVPAISAFTTLFISINLISLNALALQNYFQSAFEASQLPEQIDDFSSSYSHAYSLSPHLQPQLKTIQHQSQPLLDPAPKKSSNSQQNTDDADFGVTYNIR